MGFLADAVSRKADDGSLALFREIYGGRLSKAGVAVDWRTAIRVATVLACVRVKAEGLASVPLKVYRKTDGRRDEATGHPLHYVLAHQPNPWQDAFAYRETIGLHLAMAGRHYSFINRARGRIAELIPLLPGCVEAKREGLGPITYRVTMENGSSETFPQEAIWHVRGLSWNGWEGLDVMDLAREAIGLTIAAEHKHARLFTHQVAPSGVYSVEGTLDDKQYEQLRKFLVKNHAGEMSGMPMVLDRSAKWLSTAMSGVDMQHYETRRHQVEEVCRAMGVLPIAIGHGDKTATFASAEAFFAAHDRITMLPQYQRVEQAAAVQLLGRKAIEEGYYVKHVLNGLMRASAKDRADYYAKALGSGGSPAWLTQDEVREYEEHNPMGGPAGQLPVATNGPNKPVPRDGANAEEED